VNKHCKAGLICLVSLSSLSLACLFAAPQPPSDKNYVAVDYAGPFISAVFLGVHLVAGRYIDAMKIWRWLWVLLSATLFGAYVLLQQILLM